MNLSYRWLGDMVDLDGTNPDQIQHLLTFHAAEVEDWHDIGGDLEAVRTARVTAVRPHPDADKLSVCPHCGAILKGAVDCERYIPVEGSWNGSALFTLRMPRGRDYFICTRDFLESARDGRWRNFLFTAFDAPVKLLRLSGNRGIDYLGTKWPPDTWYPVRPDEALLMNRTGSMASRVGPAVTSRCMLTFTLCPASRRWSGRYLRARTFFLVPARRRRRAPFLGRSVPRRVPSVW